MNVSIFSKMDYENISDWTLGENKPNSKPIQSQSNPILSAIALAKAEQTQNKPNMNPKQTQSNPISKKVKPWAKYFWDCIIKKPLRKAAFSVN